MTAMLDPPSAAALQQRLQTIPDPQRPAFAPQPLHLISSHTPRTSWLEDQRRPELWDTVLLACDGTSVYANRDDLCRHSDLLRRQLVPTEPPLAAPAATTPGSASTACSQGLGAARSGATAAAGCSGANGSSINGGDGSGGSAGGGACEEASSCQSTDDTQRWLPPALGSGARSAATAAGASAAGAASMAVGAAEGAAGSPAMAAGAAAMAATLRTPSTLRLQGIDGATLRLLVAELYAPPCGEGEAEDTNEGAEGTSRAPGSLPEHWYPPQHHHQQQQWQQHQQQMPAEAAVHAAAAARTLGMPGLERRALRCLLRALRPRAESALGAYLDGCTLGQEAARSVAWGVMVDCAPHVLRRTPLESWRRLEGLGVEPGAVGALVARLLEEVPPECCGRCPVVDWYTALGEARIEVGIPLVKLLRMVPIHHCGREELSAMRRCPEVMRDPVLTCQLLEAALQLPPEPPEQAPDWQAPGWQLQQAGRLAYEVLPQGTKAHLEQDGYRLGIVWEVDGYGNLDAETASPPFGLSGREGLWRLLLVMEPSSPDIVDAGAVMPAAVAAAATAADPSTLLPLPTCREAHGWGASSALRLASERSWPATSTTQQQQQLLQDHYQRQQQQEQQPLQDGYQQQQQQQQETQPQDASLAAALAPSAIDLTHCFARSSCGRGGVGNNGSCYHHMGLYLQHTTHRGSNDGQWLRCRLHLVNRARPAASISCGDGHRWLFSRGTPQWGFCQVAACSKIETPDSGFLLPLAGDGSCGVTGWTGSKMLTVALTVHVDGEQSAEVDDDNSWWQPMPATQMGASIHTAKVEACS